MNTKIKIRLKLSSVIIALPFFGLSQTLSLSPSFTTNLKVSPFQRFVNLSKMANRWGTTSPIPTTQKSGATANANGVKYFINKGTSPVLPSPSTGASQVQTVSNDLVVCKTTPKTIARQLSGVFFIGTPINPSQSIIYPGALFQDDNVVQGNFTPLSLPRKAGSITIDVLNLNGTVSENVSNFNDKTVVNNAINSLRTKTGNSFANTYLQKFNASFEASSQINVSLETNMDINLAPIIQVPAQVAANNSTSFTFENSLNAATAAIYQVYYMISVGGEGPKSTIQGTIPSNALCVTDVAYGRTAFLTVGSYSSRFDASLVMDEMLSLGLDSNVTVADADRQLSASAKFALQSGFVKLTITGGSVASAVAVSSMQSFRNYIEQIDPTVAGSQAVPIFYSLRYAADEAPASFGAFASYNDEECFRADQLKITLSSIKATSVDDFGNEELYGTVSAGSIGKVYSGNTSLWTISNSSPVQAGTNANILANTTPGSVTFNLNPATTSATAVGFTINIKDKIMPLPDPEWLGASDAAKANGFVQYVNSATGGTSFSVSLSDIKNAPNGILNQTFIVQQGSSAKVAVTVQFQLINNTAVRP